MAVIITIPTYASMPSGLVDGNIVYAQDTARHYMISSGTPYIIPNLNDSPARRTYVNGVAKNGTAKTGDIIEWIDATTIVSGNAVFNLTSDHTATGTALCSAIFPAGADATSVDATASYPRGVATVSTNLKQVTIPFTKETVSGLVVVGITVVGSVTFVAAPNGTTINCTIIGVAA